MANDNEQLVSMAQQFTGLPMDSLIGGPLNAAANANAAMAVTQTKFMLDTCFNSSATPPADQGPPTENFLEPIMINMSITRGVITPGAEAGSPAEIQTVTTTFSLPLLTIIPLNSLGVDEVNVTFEMEVQSSYSDTTNTASSTHIAGETSFTAKAGWGPVSVTITGSASYDKQDSSEHNTHYQKSNSAKYTVLVHASQLPLPSGVSTIIKAYTNAIQPITLGSASGG